ncbi:uncharacterized protein VTP21DRAFT_11122 [Calcarisporiella thermophila]|uniref:uncharacterized protein n=1 Tax=Calcarisporiella thermophila TaxID=911321 RepID=UPI0037435C9B
MTRQFPSGPNLISLYLLYSLRMVLAKPHRVVDLTERGFFDDDGTSKFFVGACALLVAVLVLTICCWVWRTNGRNINSGICIILI